MSTEAAAPPLPYARWALHLGLLLLTFVFTTMAGLVLARDAGFVGPTATWAGLGFALTLLTILVSHEMGHYVFARIHRVDTTLPFVIPIPPVIPGLPGLGLISFGTLGAVIRMRSPIGTRDALIDIGAAGPIAGAIVALPLLALGLSWSPIVPSPTASESFWFGHQTLFNFGLDAYHQLRAAMLHVPFVPPPSQHAASIGDNLLLRLMTWLIHGRLPVGSDIQVHPVAEAAWFGLLVTSLNLFPMGQLDGGHVSYAVFGEHTHRWIGRAVSWATLFLAFFSCFSWLFWWFVTRWVIGFGHPPVRDRSVELGGLRLAIAAISLVLLVLTFIPVPYDQF
jgi:membrane-associated protease RseP (regulator of RpoE activity)